MLTVAIASEYDDFDGEVYRVLLEQVLGIDIERWKTEQRFTGYRSVWKTAPAYLRTAAQQDIHHALLAIDNDGTSHKHPEHDESHNPSFASDNDGGCRFCWLESAIPDWWREEGNKQCLAVPVQTIETWLLILRGDDLAPSPEACFSYNRTVLKRKLFEAGLPLTEKTRVAVDLLRNQHFRPRLEARRSFQCFREQLIAWR